MSEKPKKAGKKKGYYAVQFGRTDDNKKRKLRRHIRSNPGDKQAIVHHEKKLGKVDNLGPTSKGRKLIARHDKLMRNGALAATKTEQKRIWKPMHVRSPVYKSLAKRFNALAREAGKQTGA
jgi:hypothetical protein